MCWPMKHCERYVITSYYKDKSFYYLIRTKDFCLYRFSPYRAVNTIRLGYKNKSVYSGQGDSNCWFWGPFKQRDTLCKKNVEIFKDTFIGTYIDHRALVNSCVY